MWKLKLSQVAPILPYLLLVVMLIVRPKGIMGPGDEYWQRLPTSLQTAQRGVRIVVWSAFAAILLLLPLAAGPVATLTLLFVSPTGIAAIIPMSYNMLLGQSGHAFVRPCRLHQSGHLRLPFMR